MLSTFPMRFVIAVFGGAAVGLVIGLVVTYVFQADDNPFAMMPWGIMAGALGLAFSMVPRRGAAEKQTQDSGDRPT
jgi:NhaP-type Na+/H+ or K+/H+ antiporter